MSSPSPAGEPVPTRPGWRLWRYGRALAVPLLVWLLLVGALVRPVLGWLRSEERYDEAAMQEWLEEARNADTTLADLVAGYVQRVGEQAALQRRLEAGEGGDTLLRSLRARELTAVKQEEIYQHLRSLAEPPTKMYPGQLPLFPLVYRLEVHFRDGLDGMASTDGGPRLDDPIVWDSGLDPSSGQYRQSSFPLGNDGVVMVRYQLRAWNKRQRDEERKGARLRQIGLLALAATGLALAWLALVYADESESQRQRELARLRVEQAERQRGESERQLLEQRLATQAAEQKSLELKSHLYASIGIMAGSYAHNIKNLLVRPNDLLRRCLEREEADPEQSRRLREVQETLGMVTERLQQILQTVRRDPSQSRLEVLDLNHLVGVLLQTWRGMAADRWRLDLEADLAEGTLRIAGDESHLQQAVENLLFNARDATFEMRSVRRDEARQTAGDGPARRQALIAAAGWRGVVRVRTWSEGDEVVLEVSDNGAGMTEEVRQRCTQAHFSTKRDNALYEGHSTGMGLGLSFVVSILENHQGRLEIESTRFAGTTFRVRFPRAKE